MNKCWQLYKIRLVNTQKSCIIVQILPKKAKFGQIASSPRLFTPTYKYFYTDITAISVTFSNSEDVLIKMQLNVIIFPFRSINTCCCWLWIPITLGDDSRYEICVGRLREVLIIVWTMNMALLLLSSVIPWVLFACEGGWFQVFTLFNEMKSKGWSLQWRLDYAFVKQPQSVKIFWELFSETWKYALIVFSWINFLLLIQKHILIQLDQKNAPNT